MKNVLMGLFAVWALAVSGTTYVWTGAGGTGAQGKYYMSNAANWEGNTVPTSGDDVILDFSGLPSAATTINNDIGALRIRGIKINCPLNNGWYYFQGGDLTLVGSGTGESSYDTYRTGNGNFVWQGTLKIVGDYYFYTTGNRTRLYANVSSDSADTRFRVYGATMNVYGDWSGFQGERYFNNGRVDFCATASTPENVTIYSKAVGGQVFFSDMETAGLAFHSPIRSPENVTSGNTRITADCKDGSWDGDIIVPHAEGATFSQTWAVTANKNFTFANGFTGTGVTLCLSVGAGAVATLAGDQSFVARNLSLVSAGTLLCNRTLPNLVGKNIYCYGGGTFKMGVANALAGNSFRFGSGANLTGTFDLNGFDQEVQQLVYSGSSGGAYTGFHITSATPATLLLRSSSTLCALVENEATVLMTNGTLTVSEAIAQGSTGALGLTGSGTLDLTSCSAVNPQMVLKLNSGTHVNLPANSTFAFNQILVNGSSLRAGTYDAAALSQLGVDLRGTDAALTALMTGHTEPGSTSVWQGGSANEDFYTAANWETGVPENQTGSAVVDFTSGSASSVVAGTPFLNKLIFGRAAGFTLSATAGGGIDLSDGGIVATAGVTEVSAPLRLTWTPQTWSIASNATLKLSGGVSAAASEAGVLVKDGGTLELSAASANLQQPLVVTGGTHVLVSANQALGPAANKLTLFCANPDANYDYVSYLKLANGITCANPIDILGATGDVCDPNASVTFGGKFTVLNGGKTGRTFEFDVPQKATCTFAGGIDCGSIYRFIAKVASGSAVYVRDNPIAGWTGNPSSAEINLQTPNSTKPLGTFHLAATGNDWRTFRVMAGGVVCEVANALARDGWVLFGRADWCAQSTGEGMYLDLNGYDQLTCGASTQWSFTSSGKTYNTARYATVKSATPATLTMTPTCAYTSNESGNALYGALRFEGEASLRFAPTTVASTFNIAYQVSTTKGTLEVSSGTLNLVRGAGWGAGDVLVNGEGTLGVDADSLNTAFGGVNGEGCLYLSGNGKISIPAGQTVVVRSVNFDGHYLRGGTYGAADSGAANTAYAAHFVAGGGILRSRMSAKPGVRIIIR